MDREKIFKQIAIIIAEKTDTEKFGQTLMWMDSADIRLAQKILGVMYPKERTQVRRKARLDGELREREARKRTIGKDLLAEWDRVCQDLNRKVKAGYRRVNERI